MTQPNPNNEIPKAYDHGATERRIYDFWEGRGYFTPAIDRSKKTFVIIMPPPNVTGELHTGHALTIAIQDLVVRWHRMLGESSLYLPGTDHAGIATQWVVERMLAKEGITRHDLGRDLFVKRMWTWVEEYGDSILRQLRRLGASCDWTRRRFTLDDGPSKAVRTTFVNLYKKGLIYRGERITNWCPRCASALSDLEVKHKDEDASLYYIKYPIEDSAEYLTIATTRPETMMADTAVAVNPDDKRYRHLIGKRAFLPIMDRHIPIIGDEAVDLEFGTGALKVTPGHDPDDFEIGQRHDLETINVMNLDGTMNENAAAFESQDRFKCREGVVERLKTEGRLELVEPYTHSVGHCDRCAEIVEPIVTEQWYVRVAPLAKPARDAVANRLVQIVPERFEKVYFNWMDNIRDWCISRQLWWGHRIPVWYCDSCGEVVVEMEDPDKCPQCASASIHRDEDVLDTWFSSGLWTHSTLGWPEQTEDLDYFYPTNLMETGYDILFLWVARMIMMGIENTGQAPFDMVYLHGLVLDPEGVRMSKTRGNVVDPLELIDMYGADAVRFSLTTRTSPGNDMRLNESKLEASRNFVNKLWNAARFVMSNVENAEGLEDWEYPRALTHREDRWIISRLNQVMAQVDDHMKQYQFGEAQRVLHDFLWSEYCDWYLEMSKVRIRSGDEPSPLPVLAHVLEHVLRLLHPFLPFITEEIWQSLRSRLPSTTDAPDALVVASYPQIDRSRVDADAEREVEAILELVRAARNVRAVFRIEKNQTIQARVTAASELQQVFIDASLFIKSGAGIELTVVNEAGSESGSEEAVHILGSGTLAMAIGGLVDISQETVRLREELAQLTSYRQQIADRLADQQFLARAPEQVVERDRERLGDADERTARLSDTLARLGGG